MNKLHEYIENPEIDLANFNLGLFYEKLNHYAPASGFYLRCAERTKNIDLRYESLIRMYFCYSALGDRNQTCESILKQAIALCPKKPEAYFFITQYYELKLDWLNVYTYSCIALANSSSKSLFVSEIDFPDLYCLFFQKAAAAWWIGKPNEARCIFRNLLKDADKFTDKYKNLLEINLSKLGAGPESQSIKRYTKDLRNKLKFSFKGIENIDQNFSQVYQDMFVLAVLNGKRNGTYLEIGAADPFKNSNTALLETRFGWTGVGIEYDDNFVQQHRNHRKNPVICSDALLINYEKLLCKYFPNQKNVDYLQLDIEPPRNTFEALLSIPFEKYKFAVITYEHDYYVDITKSYKQKSRDYLKSIGYRLVVGDISPDENSPFEDWWIHPDLVDLRCDFISDININKIESYFLN